MSFPYCPTAVLSSYFRAHLWNEFTGEMNPTFQAYCDQMTCPTFSHVDLVIPFLLDWSAEDADDVLLEEYREMGEEAEIHREEDAEYRADQERWDDIPDRFEAGPQW